MSKAHGRTKEELKASGADPNVDHTEGSRGEDTWWDLGTRRLRRFFSRRRRRPN